jgi:hypothetical protein
VLSNRGEPTLSGKQMIERRFEELSPPDYFFNKNNIDLIYTYVVSEVLKVVTKKSNQTFSRFHSSISQKIEVFIL